MSKTSNGSEGEERVISVNGEPLGGALVALDEMSSEDQIIQQELQELFEKELDLHFENHGEIPLESLKKIEEIAKSPLSNIEEMIRSSDLRKEEKIFLRNYSIKRIYISLNIEGMSIFSNSVMRTRIFDLLQSLLQEDLILSGLESERQISEEKILESINGVNPVKIRKVLLSFLEEIGISISSETEQIIQTQMKIDKVGELKKRLQYLKTVPSSKKTEETRRQMEIEISSIKTLLCNLEKEEE